MAQNRTIDTPSLVPSQIQALELSRLDRLLEVPGALDDDVLATLRTVGQQALLDDGEDAFEGEREYATLGSDSFHPGAGLRPLTAEDEVRLARRIEFARQRVGWTIAGAAVSAETRNRYLALTGADAARFEGAWDGVAERPDASHIQARWREWLHFRNELIEHNLLLVERISLRYRTYGIPHGDLVQHGNLGLIRAADKFDWRRNVRFRTYAEWWIRQSIERATDTDRDVIHVPRPMRQKLSKANHLNRKAGGTTMDARKFAELMGLDREAAAHAFAIKSGVVSLDRTGTDDGRPMRNDIVGPDLGSRDEVENLEHLRTRLRTWIKDLPARECQVLNLRYGLDGGEPRTLEQVGEVLGISRERVRQLQARAIDQLRDAVADPVEY